MSTLWTAQDLVAATGGQWLREPPPGWTASGFCYAAAIHQPGDMLFVRSYLGELGMLPLHARPLLPHSTGVLCTTADVVPDGPWPAFLVPEAYTGLMDVARYARGCFRGRVHAVTGSAGKTSICALLAFALSRLGPTITTSHNTNLPPGVARTLAGVPPSAGHVVLELAIGRMGTSTRLARPHVAIFSNVAAAHLKYHTTLEQVAERKSLIFTGLEPGGTAVLNCNMDHFDVVVTAARRHAGRVVTYGEGPTADLRLVNHTPDGVVRAVIHGEPVEYVLGPPGRHMALNSLAVLAALEAEGMDWRHHVLPALTEARPVAGRGEAHDLLLDGRALRLIDDAYNANPASMRAAPAGDASRCSATCWNWGRTRRAFTPIWRDRWRMPGLTWYTRRGRKWPGCGSACPPPSVASGWTRPPRWSRRWLMTCGPGTWFWSRARTGRACIRW